MTVPADPGAAPAGLTRRLAAFVYEGVLLFGVLFFACFAYVVLTRQQDALFGLPGYVFAFVFVMALFLWMTDKTLEWVLYDLILGWKR